MTDIQFAWHVHHRDELVEPLFAPIEERIEDIKENKPEEEIPTRLALLKLVRGELPAEIIKAGDAYIKAWEAYHKAGEGYYKAREAYYKAGEAYHKAREAYHKALADHREEIEALHERECPDCPWDGKTIFPREGETK